MVAAPEQRDESEEVKVKAKVKWV